MGYQTPNAIVRRRERNELNPARAKQPPWKQIMAAPGHNAAFNSCPSRHCFVRDKVHLAVASSDTRACFLLSRRISDFPRPEFRKEDKREM